MAAQGCLPCKCWGDTERARPRPRCKQSAPITAIGINTTSGQKVRWLLFSPFLHCTFSHTVNALQSRTVVCASPLAAALTGSGMRQMAALGRDTRARYVDEFALLSGRYDYREVYVRSSDSPRCMQSASAFGIGLFPDGTGPAGFLASRPTLLPVHAQIEEDDDLLDSRKAHCRLRVKADSRQWLNRTGRHMIAAHDETLRRMASLCGFNFTSIHGASGKAQAPASAPAEHATAGKPKSSAAVAADESAATHVERLTDGRALDHEYRHLQRFQALHDYAGDLPTAIKDIADALIFDRLQRLPPGVPGLGDADWTAIHDLAFRIFYSRYFVADDQVVYMSGKLPFRILKNFDNVLNGLPNKARKLYSYHTHRDMMYSFASFFGISFHGPGVTHVPGVPQGFIPPATAMFIELHDSTSAPEDTNASAPPWPSDSPRHFVRVFLWLPCNETASPADLTDASLAQSSCPFTQVALDGCARDCPLSHLVAVAERREASTGGWKKLCSRLSRDSLHEFVDSAATRLTRFSWLVKVAFALLVTSMLLVTADARGRSAQGAEGSAGSHTRLLWAMTVLFGCILLWTEFETTKVVASSVPLAQQRASLSQTVIAAIGSRVDWAVETLIEYV